MELDGSAGAAPGPKVLHIGHGDHILKTKVVDKAGNESPLVERSIKVDINGPLDTTTVPSGWVTTGDEVAIQVSGTDPSGRGVERIEWKLTNTATGAKRSGDVAGAGPVPLVVSGNGVHLLETRLTDGMGDDSGWRTRYVRIDNVTPTDDTDASTDWIKKTVHNVTVGGTDLHSDIAYVEWNSTAALVAQSGAQPWWQSPARASTRFRRAS